MHALKADTYRKSGQTDAQSTLKAALLDPAFRVLACLRLCQAAQQLPSSWRWLAVLPARLLYRVVSQLAGIEIPWRTDIAPGLALTHGRGIVVNAGARIGRNVTLFHGVTLGQRDHIDAQGRRHTLYPVIEDEVWIGPHAIIVGGVTVGKGQPRCRRRLCVRGRSAVLSGAGKSRKDRQARLHARRAEPLQRGRHSRGPGYPFGGGGRHPHQRRLMRGQPQRPA